MDLCVPLPDTPGTGPHCLFLIIPGFLPPGHEGSSDSWLASPGYWDFLLWLGLVASGSFEAESQRQGQLLKGCLGPL